MKFYVPSYQRGYRWTERQVSDLLKDIWEFRQASQDRQAKEFYCLQPIVVAKKDHEWILIDGQQRLTTIHLILSFLKNQMAALEKEKFTLRYATRPESEAFLKKIEIERAEENIDFFHLCRAYQAIENWFKDKDGTIKIHFLTTLLSEDSVGKNVKVIWYEIADNISHVDVFTRINMGKIPLTNGELVKALLLGNVKETYGEQKIDLKQLQIASEWDRIENSLQDESLWYFIFDGRGHYDTRIEYIFDLMTEKDPEEDVYYTFHEFQEQLLSGTSIDEIWRNVKSHFQQFEEWYRDRELYHLIGYLVATGTPARKLLADAIGKSKIEFRSHLSKEIARGCNYEIESVRYKSANVKPLLLLFNIQTIVSNKHCNIRFPFDQYKTETWDIEHIRSVKSDPPIPSKRREWLQTVIEYFEGESIDEKGEGVRDDQMSDDLLLVAAIKNILNHSKISDLEFQNIYEKVLSHFNENSEPATIHSISNLTLLDFRTNRSYKNAVFPIKRRKIALSDRTGTFVPLCTKNVFLKSYSSRFEGAMFWTPKDAEAYLKEIIRVVSPYFTLNSESNV
jgi:hypothetical protein